MRLENLKKFNHGKLGTAYTITGLTSEQYNKIYLQACEQYNSIEQHVNMSLFEDKMSGYILCK